MRSMKMMMMTGALLLVGTVAQAQDAPTAEVTGSGDGSGVVYERETSYDFEDDAVTGSLLRPDGDMLSGQRHGKQSSLINIRADFIPEMVRSVEDM